MGKGGLILAIATAVAMSIMAFLTGATIPNGGESGLCLPSPADWNLLPVASWTINLAILLLSALGLGLLNRSFSVVPGQASSTLSGLFLIMATSIPWIGGALTTSVIIAPAIVIVMAILFGSYRQSNATQELFAIATILSLGSMLQYAFLLMIVPVLVSALMFKCLRVREVIAFGMGLIAPYWVAIGFGILPLESLTMPSLTNLFAMASHRGVLLICLINLGFTALLSLVLALYNGVRLYAGNTRRRQFNMAVNMFGLTCLAGMVFDSSNLSAYIVTFYMSAAFQQADLFALWHFRRPWIGALIISALYITSFLMCVL